MSVRACVRMYAHGLVRQQHVSRCKKSEKMRQKCDLFDDSDNRLHWKGNILKLIGQPGSMLGHVETSRSASSSFPCSRTCSIACCILYSIFLLKLEKEDIDDCSRSCLGVIACLSLNYDYHSSCNGNSFSVWTRWMNVRVETQVGRRIPHGIMLVCFMHIYILRFLQRKEKLIDSLKLFILNLGGFNKLKTCSSVVVINSSFVFLCFDSTWRSGIVGSCLILGTSLPPTWAYAGCLEMI